jgi:hypothetical protein
MALPEKKDTIADLQKRLESPSYDAALMKRVKEETLGNPNMLYNTVDAKLEAACDAIAYSKDDVLAAVNMHLTADDPQIGTFFHFEDADKLSSSELGAKADWYAEKLNGHREVRQLATEVIFYNQFASSLAHAAHEVITTQLPLVEEGKFSAGVKKDFARRFSQAFMKAQYFPEHQIKGYIDQYQDLTPPVVVSDWFLENVRRDGLSADKRQELLVDTTGMFTSARAAMLAYAEEKKNPPASAVERGGRG